jgi:hypothetical protein
LPALTCSHRQPPHLFVRAGTARFCLFRADLSTSNVNETLTHLQKTIEPVVRKLNYTLSGFEGAASKSPYHVTLSIKGGDQGLEPAPITSPNDPSFAFMAGTIKAVFGEDVIVAPTGMYGELESPGGMRDGQADHPSQHRHR